MWRRDFLKGIGLAPAVPGSGAWLKSSNPSQQQNAPSIRHSRSSFGARGTDGVTADDIIIETVSEEETFSIGGSGDIVLRLTDTEAGDSVTVRPGSSSRQFEVTTIEFGIYNGRGQVDREGAQTTISLNGPSVDYKQLNVDVGGDIGMFTREMFSTYTVELLDDSTGEVLSSTDERLVGIGYDGRVGQDGRYGTIDLRLPRDREVEPSWHIEFILEDPDTNVLDPPVRKEIENPAGTDAFTFSIDASAIDDGVYSSNVIFRRDRADDIRILNVFGVEDIVVGDGEPVTETVATGNYDTQDGESTSTNTGTAKDTDSGFAVFEEFGENVAVPHALIGGGILGGTGLAAYRRFRNEE